MKTICYTAPICETGEETNPKLADLTTITGLIRTNTSSGRMAHSNANTVIQPQSETAARRTAAVIVPAYNAEATIGACIESLLAQARAPDEIVVVDDASTDGTAEVVARYPIRLVRLTRNSGPGVARNEGAKVASADILAFTDSDCVAPPDWLARLERELDDEGIVAVTGGYAGTTAPGFLPLLQHLVLRERQAKLPDEIASTITSNFACRRRAFEAIGGFPLYYRRRDPRRPVWGNEDEELGFLLTRAGGRIRWLRDAGVWHRFRPGLGGYLRQQKFYAERIAMSHFRFPEMRKTRTNYSRQDGAFSVLSAGGSASGVVSSIICLPDLHREPDDCTTIWFFVIAAMLLWLLSPVPAVTALRHYAQGWRFLFGAYGVALLVSFSWLWGVASSVILSFGGFIDEND